MTATIVVCGLAGLDAALAAHEPEVVVSLIGAGEVRPLGAARRRHLHLVCHDVESDRGRFRAPTHEQVDRLVDEVDAWTRARPMLIHCHGGRSRSWGAAFVAACHVGGGEAEDALAARILALAPWARPHRGIVEMGDALLGRGGRMREAMRFLHGDPHGSIPAPRGHASRAVALDVTQAA